MYNIEFYENQRGYSDVWDFLEVLRIQSESNKDSRIQYNQITFMIEMLKNNGTYLPDTMVKHLSDGIWELRPGKNRVLFFFFRDNTFVLLHHFKKKTQKTPVREIEKAKKERADYLLRKDKLI